MENVFDKKNVFALVGASNNSEKYGNIVFQDLTSAGYKVIPINPHEEAINGVKAFPSIEDVEEKIDIVIFVIPPKIVLGELEKIKKLGIKFVWMQPGSESEEAIKFCEDNKIECMHNACVMIQRPKE